MTKKLIGVFHSGDEVVSVVKALKNQGYTSDEISIIAKDDREVKSINAETDTSTESSVVTGATTGGVLGGVAGLLAGLGALTIPGIGPFLAAGPIAGALGGAVLGASAGGLTGALVDMGIPEDEAKVYNDYLERGDILVFVEAREGRYMDVYDTYRQHNSVNSDMYRDYPTM